MPRGRSPYVYVLVFVYACLNTLSMLSASEVGARPGSEAAPVYTNEDLERVRPQRDETGVASTPAFKPEDPPAAGSGRRGRAARPGREAASEAPAGKGETHWRREAQRVRERARLWRGQAEELRRRIDARRRKPGVRPYSDELIVEWQRKAEALDARVREQEGDLDDRARREGALPGWLR